MKVLAVIILVLFTSVNAIPQRGEIKWASGSSYFTVEDNSIVLHTLPLNDSKVLVSEQMLTPEGYSAPLEIRNFSFTPDQQKVLIFTNTKRVWRINTKGDYWVIDLPTSRIKQVGKTMPESSLMFAKLSPDGKYVAYVSQNNLYVEDLATSEVKPLTTNGSVTMINGTFDWVYEEEFFCRDGFRWSPDSKSIAYWQIDAKNIRKFYMINNTDSIYSQIVPVEYPVVGQKPSSCRVGVVTVSDAKTTWINVPGDPEQNYIVRMEFIPSTNNLLLQQLNRKQNDSKLFISNSLTGETTLMQEETDEKWVDLYIGDDNTYAVDYTNKFTWLNGNKSILWVSEKDGWKHLYQVSLVGEPEVLITKGNYDIISVKYIDTKTGYVYFMASPENATQKYLYRTKLNGKGTLEKITPAVLEGTNDYSFSPDGKYASHTFSSHCVRPAEEIIKVADQKPLNEKKGIVSRIDSLKVKSNTEFFKITTADNVEMDGWMVKPKNFDPSKKYPVVFYVYTEPWGATVVDSYGASYNYLYAGDMAEDGYIYMSLDNRGTPAPKGREWRKSIYRQIGRINIHDQAMAAKEILKWSFVDPERIAVWGWSGGGSATLNLMFQYPDIYKTGIAIAAVSNLLTYDNVYQERYMGLPQENMEDFILGSPLTYVKNLKGNLLYIHGTGDDNVHYQNAEMLFNELIKYNKQIQMFSYPNRTHGISEGEGTFMHLVTLYTNYLKTYCPPGGR